ncbi:Cell division cycle protein 20 like protein [Myotis davidii]|uniref:Cell division cycle protein 20 like protein n=1 Tax=Myotis davidii TaxID=225400 RepID=L5LUJ0_MYODS|nr:Cell division cycle protein 20 like protein [Myotis davidii]
MQAANRSHAPGRTLGRTPGQWVRRGTADSGLRVPSLGRQVGLSASLSTLGKSGSKIQTIPWRGRSIPHRSAAQMEVASFLLSKENRSENSQTPTKKEHQKAWALNRNGFDVEEARILRLSGKPQKVPEGYENRLKVLYSQKAMPGSSKRTCHYIPSLPDQILDAPEIRNDYYLNRVDWSSGNVLAVALDHSVYLWSTSTGDALQLLQMEQPGNCFFCVLDQRGQLPGCGHQQR